jgi:hypothetical protein
MNERIKELYEQSLIRETDKDHAGNPMLVIKQNTEKFAELIIKECIELNKQELAFNAFERMLTRYKEHFGIEE